MKLQSVILKILSRQFGYSVYGPPYCPGCGSGCIADFYRFGIKRVCVHCGECEMEKTNEMAC